jgi:hypothetical protein
MRHRLIAAAAATLAIAAPAAAAVRYDFFTSFSGSSSGSSFSLTRANFITGPLSVDVADLDSCLTFDRGPAPCGGVDFVPADPSGADRVGLRIGTGERFFYFPLRAFMTAGLHHDDLGLFRADLTVTKFADGAVPEPASWALMILGFGLAGATLRRRRAALAA